MKVTVLVPSEEYKSYAGARIRYGRLSPELQRLGIDLHLAEIESVDPNVDASDALLISKCHDARALVAAAAGRRRGQLVGVDLFDDYFSQTADSRLTRFRSWLAQLLPLSDFALCSTPVMAEVVGSYASDLPVHVVNDPGPPLDSDALSTLLANKLARVQREQSLRLAWFGVGDNPNFRVGLTDLAGFGGMLKLLARSAADVRLTVLTNARALTAEGLALVAGLPVPTTVVEWSEDRERALLDESFACFLPVNAQRFSAAKSLNRAITALSAGCQVISAGYPLYALLGDLIYRDTDRFLDDLASGAMKHSVANLETFGRTIEATASPRREAAALAQFLGAIPRHSPGTDMPLALIQGHSPNGVAHKAVKTFGGLSVASPYCPPTMGFDVVFHGAPGDLGMYVAESAAGRLLPDTRRRLDASTIISDRKFWFVPPADGPQASRSAGLTPADEPWYAAPLPFQIATYGDTLERIRERMEAAFGKCQLLVSEHSQLPFSPEL